MDLTEITKDLAEIAEIVFGINSAEYESEIREIPYSESYYENHKCLTLKKINRDYFNDYFNDPYYQVECYDFEPITKIDGGGFDDIFKGVKLTGYKTTKSFFRNLHDMSHIPEECYIFNKAKLKSEIEMCLKLSEFLSK